MPLDPALIAEVKSWLSKAHSDLELAEYILQSQPRFLSHVVFHRQQSVEKTLKGFLTSHRQPFPKSHDLINLGVRCSKIDDSLTQLLRETAVLTKYAWQYRYPGESDEPDRQEAEKAVSLAKQVYSKFAERLPKEATNRID
jgi:HEPN domain-containing protein